MKSWHSDPPPFEDPRHVIITAELIDSLMSRRGGFTTRVIRFITGGQRPSSGWRHRHIGQMRSRREFVELLEMEADRDGGLKVPRQKRRRRPEAYPSMQASDAETVTITAKLVESLETPRGGYTCAAIAFITGGDAKPASGWKRHHLGETRSRRDYVKLLEDELRAEAKRARKRRRRKDRDGAA
jgi:hypothetical protein